MVIRNVILDWSGTLVDDLMPVLATTNHVLESCGLPAMTREEFRAQFCLPIRKFYENRLPHVPQARLEEIFLAEYPKHHAEITLLPHTREFLQFCRRQGMGVYVASTVDAHTYETQMTRFGIGSYITKPYIGIADKTSKIHHILEENDLDRDETMFVGDMEHDVEAGKAGGIHTCAVLTGYNLLDKLRAMKPDLICHHLGELQQFFATPEAVRG
ncbi:MAG TPA: HAD family hydrolase [Verrucomicrobiae bacterium]|nr:HAD family hydrolase [Verrucomicrobiae bacterium]